MASSSSSSSSYSFPLEELFPRSTTTTASSSSSSSSSSATARPPLPKRSHWSMTLSLSFFLALLLCSALTFSLYQARHSSSSSSSSSSSTSPQQPPGPNTKFGAQRLVMVRRNHIKEDPEEHDHHVSDGEGGGAPISPLEEDKSSSSSHRRPKAKGSPFWWQIAEQERLSQGGRPQKSKKWRETLFGGVQYMGEYYVPIEMGNPPRLFTVLVDTGSVGLAIPALQCQEYTEPTTKDESPKPTGLACGHDIVDHPTYDPAASTTGSIVPCTQNSTLCTTCSSVSHKGDEEEDALCLFEMGYADGSYLFGVQYRDRLTLGGLSATVRFDLIHGESESFASNQLSGIMGMAYQNLSMTDGDAVWQRLVAANEVPDVFSMCLSESGGSLVLGGYDESYHAGPIDYTNIVEESYYSVELLGFQVNGSPLSVSSSLWSAAIVDSGSTLLVLPEKIYNAFEAYFDSLSVPGSTGQYNLFNGYAFSFSPEELAAFPNVSVVLKRSPSSFHASQQEENDENNTFVLNIPPSQYLVKQIAQGAIYYALGIMPAPMDGFVILGDVVMKGYNVIFDRENARVGFAPVRNCDRPEMFAYIVSKGDGDKADQIPIDQKMKHPLAVAVRYKNHNTDSSSNERQQEEGEEAADKKETSSFPAQGVAVEWMVKEGKAHLEEKLVTTDHNGLAKVGVTLKEVGPTVIVATVLDAYDQAISKHEFTFEGIAAQSSSAALNQRVVVVVLAVTASVVLLVAVLVVVCLVRRRKRRMEDWRYQQLASTFAEDSL